MHDKTKLAQQLNALRHREAKQPDYERFGREVAEILRREPGDGELLCDRWGEMRRTARACHIDLGGKPS